MKRLNFFIIISFFGWTGCTSYQTQTEEEFSKTPSQHLVDPFLGTGGHGHTYPGAVLPFGMVQLSPDNGTEGWDWSSGYHYSDSVIAGFSHLHLSGTGIGDLYDISVMPYYQSDISRGEAQLFSHKNEAASPGYYTVTFDNGIQAELTVSERVGLHRYIFPPDSTKSISIDLGFNINWDKPTNVDLVQVNDSTVTGYRKSTGWARDQEVYFAAVFSENIKSLTLERKDSADARAMFFFDKGDKPLVIKVGISSADTEGALQNIVQETSDWNFEKWQSDAADKWGKELSKLKVSMISPELDTIMYTALYHTSLAPSLFSDVQGNYKVAGKEEKQHVDNFDRYTVFSLWDTFRATHPLFTILQPGRTDDFLQSMLVFYKEQGLLPVWALEGNETNTMTGYHAVPVLTDALFKGHFTEEAELMYEAMKASAFQNIRGTDLYREYGYIPADKDGWSVTKTLEYAYDDWCIAQVAKKLGQEADYNHFMERAASYRELFDKSSLFMRGKNSDGSWVTPFDPFHSEHGFEGMYIEGTAWQHSWFVPHDVEGLIQLFGSPAKFENHLDSTFEVTSQMTGENVSVDITGLIGQYAHGNEPSHHIPYLYNYIGKPWKTQERVRQVMEQMYSTGIDGLAGNDDCGQMSAWYIFSALGFYPVNPADGNYVIGSPLIHEAEIKLSKDRSFKIKAINNSQDNKYIDDVKLNGKKLDRVYITHEEIMNGGELTFTMSDKPSSTWGTEKDSFPPSMTSVR